MMYTTNRIVLDTSVLIEALKGNKISYYQSLVSNENNRFFINEIILSEYLYYVLGLNGGSSPRSVKERKAIQQIFAASPNELGILQDFSILPSNSLMMTLVPTFMSNYNLLPNDAIILATCKIHGITQLASHDTDFIVPCKQEGIELLQEE